MVRQTDVGQRSMGKFDEKGNLADDGVKKQLTKYMNAFADFVTRMKAERKAHRDIKKGAPDGAPFFSCRVNLKKQEN